MKLEPYGILSELIDKKFNELKLGEDMQGIFSNIRYFEGNAIGQIGETFFKQIFLSYKIEMVKDSNIVHNEYDIKLPNGTQIEIKTARLGKNKTFQFNGINPRYNYNYIFLLGIWNSEARYKIITHKIEYVHKEQKFYININDKKKQLVAMNPGNQVNYKLTLHIDDLNSFDLLESELKNLFLKSE